MLYLAHYTNYLREYQRLCIGPRTLLLKSWYRWLNFSETDEHHTFSIEDVFSSATGEREEFHRISRQIEDRRAIYRFSG